MPSIVPNTIIAEAIMAALHDTGLSQVKWGELHGLQQSRISTWLNLTPKANISKKDWPKLYAAIKNYLPEDFAPDFYANSKNESIKTSDFRELASNLEKLAPGKQIVTGVINVGVPAEKIVKVINASNLSELQKNELIGKIFCEGDEL